MDFSKWQKKLMDLAQFRGGELPDPAKSIRAVSDLWREPVTGNWQRAFDQQLITGPRYRRGDSERPNPGEHWIEHEILDLFFDEVSCVGAHLIDGINALPLTRDSSGGRRGNVEADLLLLLEGHGEYQVAICEVKDSADDPWYAAIENLRQLRLFQLSSAAQEVLPHRNPDKPLPSKLSSMGLVIAPPAFYSQCGKKANVLPHAKKLLRTLGTEAKVDLRLASWDRRTKSISGL